ncbi:ran-binding protein 9 isoform X2 [Glossina fuscipes]|uniref:Ran-binding protein 9 isoform X2 n=1 Tax=Glossina fuscipes TaxID=7396 RepID=A0A9C5ZBV3_9MUSC|nr:ran-binding protein 9 isoform X2 [Glossina fuscipes]
MESGNGNDQHASPSLASASSSNNSSSSNILGNLALLPFIQANDEEPTNENEFNEELTPLQPFSVTSRADSEGRPSDEQQRTAVIPFTTTASLLVQTPTTLLGHTSSSSSPQTTFAPFLFNVSNTVNSIDQSNQVNFSLASTPLSSSNSTSTTSPLSSSSVSHILEPSGITRQQQQQQQQSLTSTLALPQSQQTFIHEHSPSPSLTIQQQQHHQASLQPSIPSLSLNEAISAPQNPERPVIASRQFNDGQQHLIADTIDASAIVQSIVANANREDQHQERQLVDPDSIRLDDNYNNDFNIDLNAVNEVQQQQLRHISSPPLDTSASGSGAHTSNTDSPSTSLPLLLHQEQQQAEESKQTPSYSSSSSAYVHHYYQHYHTPPSLYSLQSQQQQQFHHRHHHHHHHPFNLHTHSHPRPRLPAYCDFSGTVTNQIPNSTEAMFSNVSESANGVSVGASAIHTNAANSSGTNSVQIVDRLKLLYPNVNEVETPLPRCWSSHDKCVTIGLSQNNLRVQYKAGAVGVGKPQNEAASVRTAHPIPPACGIYYFEVKIISKSKNGYMGIGLTAKQFRMNRLPGCDKESYGYHGAEGNSFSSAGHAQSYGPTFTTGDIIGCCINFVNNTCFYTKNGIDLGIAFRDLPSKLYPTVGLQAPGEEVDANFGQEPFKFDQIEELMKQLRADMKATIYDFPLPSDHDDPTTLLQKMVSSYLVHNGYSRTAEAFFRTTGQTIREDMASIRNRQKILKLIMSGKMGQAIDHTLHSYPGLLESNKNLWFMLKCRQFIEMINGSDVEHCPSNKTAPVLKASVATTHHAGTTQTEIFASNQSAASSAATTTAPPNQTSVIQSTKSYQNGNSRDISSNGTTQLQNQSKDNGNEKENDDSTSINMVTITETTNNAQNSKHTAVINADNELKNQTNLVDQRSTSGGISTTNASKCNDNDYMNDVEMESNGHTTNGEICKNGNPNNFNDSIDTDEEMDVDIAPTPRKCTNGIERILEFGKDLSQMGQQLEKENKMTDEDRQMLQDAFSLIAYSNPWSSPLGWQLCPTKRETVCTALNSAILESMYYPRRPPLDYCVAHANELLKVMAQASLGACAFVNINDVFPKN